LKRFAHYQKAAGRTFDDCGARKYVEDLLKGADHITVHAEHNASPHLHRTLCQIKELGKIGCRQSFHAVRPIEYVLEVCDLVLIMSVNPGFGGQSFIPAVLPKIQTALDV